MLLNPQKQRILRVGGEICLLATLLVIAVNFKRFWRRPTTQRGFFCDDATLKYPYRADTVSQRVLYALGLYAPIALILLNEARLAAQTWQRRQRFHSGNTWRQHAATLSSATLLRPLYAALRQFLFGFAAERLIKNVGKHTLGRLRPYFLAVCLPQFGDGSTCADAHNQGVYLEQYSCQGDNTTPSMRLSFPSGHASLAFYGMTFVVLYLQRRRRSLRPSLLRQLLQVLCVLAAWFVALSRVVDYKHHWADVLAGAVLGGSTALVASFWWRRDNEASAATTRDLKVATVALKANTEAVNSLDLCDVKVLDDK